jgi:hypothetical protein
MKRLTKISPLAGYRLAVAFVYAQLTGQPITWTAQELKASSNGKV